jgi:hypothetical protein
MTRIPRCPRCGQPLAVFEGASYCPDCTSYRPVEEPPKDRRPCRHGYRHPDGECAPTSEPIRDTLPPEGF